jgi:hypothetical protein
MSAGPSGSRGEGICAFVTGNPDDQYLVLDTTLVRAQRQTVAALHLVSAMIWMR